MTDRFNNWHKFRNKFMHPNGYEWNYNGCETMREMHEFVKDMEDVTILDCDDYAAMSSSLIVFNHQDYGVTCLMIEQSASHEPREINFNPYEMKELYRHFKKLFKSYDLKVFYGD